MREIDSAHSPGTVGVICGSLARYRQLFTSLDRLKVPRGTTLLYAEGADLAQNCNKLVENMTGEWLWIMGDDHQFKPDVLLNLLNHNVGIVVPTVCRRRPFFHPVIYSIAALDGSKGQMHSWPSLSEEHHNDKLIKVEAAGSAGMLVRKYVFNTIPTPWFEWKGTTSEDVVFCWKARQAGFFIHADLTQTLGHITSCNLEPVRKPNGQWEMAITIDGYQIVLTPNANTQTWEVKNNA